MNIGDVVILAQDHPKTEDEHGIIDNIPSEGRRAIVVGKDPTDHNTLYITFTDDMEAYTYTVNASEVSLLKHTLPITHLPGWF